MPAYLIARVRVEDADRYRDYALESKPSVEAYGGKFLVRGGTHEVIEGDDASDRVVIVEFPDMAAAKGWYNSERYQAAREIRVPISDATFTLVEGA